MDFSKFRAYNAFMRYARRTGVEVSADTVVQRLSAERRLWRWQLPRWKTVFEFELRWLEGETDRT